MRFDLIITGISKVSQFTSYIEEGIQVFNMNIICNGDIRNLQPLLDEDREEIDLMNSVSLNNLTVSLKFSKTANYWFLGRAYDAKDYAEQGYSQLLQHTSDMQQFDHIRDCSLLLLQHPDKYFIEMKSLTFHALEFQQNQEDRIRIIREQLVDPQLNNDTSFILNLIPAYKSYLMNQSFEVSIYPRLEVDPIDFPFPNI